MKGRDIHIQDKSGEGHQKLWGWFGLSYASFLTLPRVLMHEMPDEWQGKMADLLDEYDAAFPNMPDISTSVVAKRRNKFVPMPEWAKNYRRPDFEAIAELRQTMGLQSPAKRPQNSSASVEQGE